MSRSIMMTATRRASSITSSMSMTIAIISVAVGGTVTVALFAFLTVWLYRRRYFPPNQDEENPPTENVEPPAYEFRPVEKLQPPKVARLAFPSFRTAKMLPHTAPVQTNEKDFMDASISPPPRSSVWRGKQWVTVTRPKLPASASSRKKERNPISEKIVISEPQKRSRVQRLSMLISKMKSEFMDVEL